MVNLANSMLDKYQHVSIFTASMLAFSLKHCLTYAQHHRATNVAVKSWSCYATCLSQ